MDIRNRKNIDKDRKWGKVEQSHPQWGSKKKV